MSDTYLTIEKEGKGIYKEKMSKFLSFAHRVTDSESAKEIIKNYQNEYHDARHVCWAYMIGPARSEWQLNDNGEPSGTAGKPILGQINSLGLTDVVVIVVRYFGGIKLGTSGLITAYREAARLALDDAGVKEMHEEVTVELTFPYISINGVMNILKKADAEILSQVFDNSCSLIFRVRKDNAESIVRRLTDLDGVMAVE